MKQRNQCNVHVILMKVKYTFRYTHMYKENIYISHTSITFMVSHYILYNTCKHNFDYFNYYSNYMMRLLIKL